MDPSLVSATLVRDLERTYATVSAAEAAFSLDTVEQRVAEETRLAIMDALARAEEGLTHTYPAGFVFEGRTYDVLVGYRDIERPTLLGVVIADVDVRAEPVRQTIAIEGSGRYDLAELMVAPRFAAHLDAIAGLTKTMFEAGYSWLDEFVATKTRELENRIVATLYKEIRLALAGHGKLADDVWLFMVQGEDGFYTFDQRAASNLVRRVRDGIGDVQRARARCFCISWRPTFR